MGAEAGKVDGKDEAVNLVEGERGVTNNFETVDDVIAASFGSDGENDLGYDLLVPGGSCLRGGRRLRRCNLRGRR